MKSGIEKWKPIEGYEGLYEVSDWGDVKSLGRSCYCGNKYRLKRDRILKGSPDKDGYIRVRLYNNGQSVFKKVHRLVAEAFTQNPDNLPQINHKDENKTNNNVDNLEWCTAKYNTNYGTHNERVKKAHINHPKTSIRVLQYTLDGELVKEWESMSEAERNGFYMQGVSMCCKGKQKKYKHFIWKYA